MEFQGVKCTLLKYLCIFYLLTISLKENKQRESKNTWDFDSKVMSSQKRETNVERKQKNTT